jgi:hypothetical protein
MKKIILVILMAIISSCSYYGAVNEKGEKVGYNENLQQQEETKEDEYSLEGVAEAISQQEENKEVEEETIKQEVKENNTQEQETKVSKNAKSNSNPNMGQSSIITKTQTAETTGKTDTATIVNNSKSETTVKSETTKATTQTKTNETKYVRNDQMIQRIRQVIQSNETEDMKNYGYTIVVDSSIKSQTNQFTFTENRVKTNIRYSFGTIRIYAEDYYSDGQLIMTQCYIL